MSKLTRLSYRQVIDLTQIIGSGMEVYPGEPEVENVYIVVKIKCRSAPKFYKSKNND